MLRCDPLLEAQIRVSNSTDFVLHGELVRVNRRCATVLQLCEV